MATLGYGRGFYGRSKWDELAGQLTSTIPATSDTTATGRELFIGNSTVVVVSNFTAVGTQVDLALVTIAAVSDFDSQGFIKVGTGSA